MTQIHILDRYSEKIKANLSNRPNRRVVFEDTHVRNIAEHKETYDFITDYSASESMAPRDRVIIPDGYGGYREFVIDDIQTDTFAGETEVHTVGSYLEDISKAKPIEPTRLAQHTVRQAVDFALFNVPGWEAGDIDYDGFRTMSWTSYNTPYDVLKIIGNAFDLQMDFTIETDGNQVTKRLVHMRHRTALFNGKEVRRGKDLENLEVQRNITDIATALICLGPESEDGDRLVTTVVDDEAQAEYGNAREYIWGLYEPSSDNADMTLSRLRTLGRTELNKRKQPKVDYTVDAVSLDTFLDHEVVHLGDMIRIKDDTEAPQFYVEATVKEVIRSIFDAAQKTYVLGDIVEYTKADITRIFEEFRAQISRRLGDTASNIDNIVTIIDTAVERRIYKQPAPPEHPILDQLWLDTSNPEKPVLKRYFNGEWHTEISAVTEPSDIDAISREQAIFEAMLASLNNLEAQHQDLLTQATVIRDNPYVDATRRDALNTALTALINHYNAMTGYMDDRRTAGTLTLAESNHIHQMMITYTERVSELRAAIQTASDYAAEHLRVLQSEYTDEKYNDALSAVANAFGLTVDGGVLKGSAVTAQTLAETRTALENQLNQAAGTLNDMIADITGDTRNLIHGTSFIDESLFTVVGGHTIHSDEAIDYVRMHAEGTQTPYIEFHNPVSYPAGSTATLALDFRSAVVDELDYTFLSSDGENINLFPMLEPAPEGFETDGEWHRYYLRFTPETDIEHARLRIGTDFAGDTVGTFDLRHIHVYRRTTDADWQPAPEDNRQYISQLSREIVDLESKLQTKLTRDDYDTLTGEISSVSTAVTQTAEALTRKADKSVVDTLNNTVTNHTTSITEHAEGIDTLMSRTALTDDKLTTVTNTANETAEGLAQTLTRVAETESGLSQAQADITRQAGEISERLKSSEYETDQAGVITRLTAGESERRQLSNEIKDSVKSTEFNTYKTQTGTLGDVNMTQYIDPELSGTWLRLARNGNLNGSGGSRAHGRFIIADRTSSQHGVVEMTAGMHYNNLNNAELLITSFSRMSSFPFTKARLLAKSTYDTQYLDVYFQPGRQSTNTIAVWLKDNIQQSGWTLMELPEAEIPEGYRAKEFDITPNASVGGQLVTHETAIMQNGKDILLKADQTTLDSVNATLSAETAALRVSSEKIQSDVSCLGTEMNTVSTRVTQNKNAFDVHATETGKRFASVEGSISANSATLTVHAREIANRVTTNTFNALNTRMNTAEATLTTQSGQIASKVSSTDFRALEGKFNNQEIGVRNLLLDSGEAVTSANYNIQDWTLAEPIADGEEVTVVFKGELNDAKSYFRLYNSGGNVTMGPNFHAADAVDGIFRATFNWRTGTTNNTYLRIYHMPNSVTGAESTIEWIKLVRGNKTDKEWTPAQEDISGTLTSHATRISNAEEIISDDNIINTVASSETFTNALNEKANAEDLSDLATKDELDGLEETMQLYTDEALGTIDLEPYVQQTDLTQTREEFDFKLSRANGMNMVKNSIGYAGIDFWSQVYSNEAETITDNALEVLGYGSGFYMPAGGGSKGLRQDINVTPEVPVTLSWYMNKMTAANDSTYRVYIQIQEDRGDGWVTTYSHPNSSTVQTNGYEFDYVTYTPETNQVRLCFIAYSSAEVIFTGIMMNLGDIPLSWTMAAGEVYNTNVRMDMSGVKVLNSQYAGYTHITPEEFAGYAEVDGEMEKVFTLNKDVTEMSKAKMDKEISMSPIKIVPLQGQYNGWAFVKEVE